MGMNNSRLQLGPSLLPAAEAAQTRQERRSSVAPNGSAPAAAAASVNKQIAVRVRDIQLTGVAPGIRPEQLRLEVASEIRTQLSAPEGKIRKPAETRPLRSGATVQEVAKIVAAAVLREAARTQETIR
jgi:hypothetical protein